MITNKCKICQKDIKTYPSQNKELCSKECFSKWQSKIKKGILPKNWHPTIGFKKGKLNPSFGTKPHWKGMRSKDGRGYIKVYQDKEEYIPEHRLIIEQKIGRKLKSEEVIHHIDGDTTNNSIENLHLFPNVGEHIKFHSNIRRYIMKELGEEWKLVSGIVKLKSRCRLCGEYVRYSSVGLCSKHYLRGYYETKVKGRTTEV